MTSQPEKSDTFEVFLEVIHEPAARWLFRYEACPGASAEEAIDYALEIWGEKEGMAPNQAYAVPSSAVSPRHFLEPIKSASYRRTGGTTTSAKL